LPGHARRRCWSLRRRRWDSNPLPPWSGDRGHGQEGPATCDSFVPVVTAPARPYPQIPDAVRTQRGPAAALTYHTAGRRPSCSCVGQGGQCVAGHRRGRRPCSAGSDEWLPGFGARVVGLSSTTSMTRARPAGIGACMSPGRMAICPSDGWESNILHAARLRTLHRLRPTPRCRPCRGRPRAWP
jgi:hypothetical protein